MTKQEQLAQAEEAYHQLMLGNKPLVVVDQNGERVEFTRANATQLKKYIDGLRLEINGSRRSPLKAVF